MNNWMKQLSDTASLALVALIFLAFLSFNGLVMGVARLDLTENSLYTLTDGTREILASIDEPITLHFFFSEKSTEDLTSLRTYAARVKAMLEEYERAADGGLELRIIDPEPFSEEEDMAATFGLQNVPVSQGGDALYFGLAGTNALDAREIIRFFQPDKEVYLEYEISKLISTLNEAGKPRLGIYSELPIHGGTDEETREETPAWIVVNQLRGLFSVDEIEAIDSGINKYDLLFVIHPKSLTDDASLFALDQFVMRGGRLVIFADPLAEAVQPEPGEQLDPSETASHLNKLTSHWGVSLSEGEVLGDAGTSLTVNTNTGGTIRHLAILGFSKQYLDGSDIVTSSLEKIHAASTGLLDIEEKEDIEVLPLISSSDSAMPIQAYRFQYLRNPADLQNNFRPTGEEYPVAVRVSGATTSAFPDGIEDYDGEVLTETDQLQVVIVADTDLLTDRLWVQVQNFFGQKISSAFADNGSFVTNLAENLSGTNALISVRSRGQFTRPFTVVEGLRKEADDRYRKNEEDLQEQLADTERQLSELQSNQVKDGVLTLTRDQQRALSRFQKEKVRIRKELRNVRHQLDRDIESLGARLKFANIVLMPMLLTGLLLLIRFIFSRRKKEASA